MNAAGPAARPSLREAAGFWLKLGLISFGGPAGQIAIMHRELVEIRRWITEPDFLRALNFCMVLPGPEAQQLATYIGWRLHGVRGGAIAGSLFFLPAAVLLWLLSWLYVSHAHAGWIAAFFYGLKPAVVAIVAGACTRIGRRALHRPASLLIALAALASLSIYRVPFPAVILGAALAGMLGPRLLLHQKNGTDEPATPFVDPAPPGANTRIAAAMALALWAAPVLWTGFAYGWQSPLAQIGLFFSKAAILTFGGAYAVLPYVAQQAVGHYGWLGPGQMLDGLALAETTPGPLIIVLQFVGFLAGWNHPGSQSPLIAATLAAGLTTWVTFLPSFVWIFAGAPIIEKTRGVRHLDGALAGVTAAVVGVIANLAIWFAAAVFFPTHAGPDLRAILLTALAFVSLPRLGVLGTLALCGGLSLFFSAV